jgi:Arc/MetJ family transcription regulator
MLGPPQRKRDKGEQPPDKEVPPCLSLHMHARACKNGGNLAEEERAMRTTIEIRPEHRAKLLELAARRGTKGFSQLVTEALEAYLRAEGDREAQRRRAALLKGKLPSREAQALRVVTAELRRNWR